MKHNETLPGMKHNETLPAPFELQTKAIPKIMRFVEERCSITFLSYGNHPKDSHKTFSSEAMQKNIKF